VVTGNRDIVLGSAKELKYYPGDIGIFLKITGAYQVNCILVDIGDKRQISNGNPF